MTMKEAFSYDTAMYSKCNDLYNNIPHVRDKVE